MHNAKSNLDTIAPGDKTLTSEVLALEIEKLIPQRRDTTHLGEKPDRQVGQRQPAQAQPAKADQDRAERFNLEAQLTSNNYTYSHSLTYTFDSYTQ
ncbi:MAG TPA: hypothetical protein VK604_02500 [Bryobacteraceae bacterium]|nr:hypothetical protein [Bryobacteraceae bacterium]